ncbi:MBOAT, membrane-bound O-acyltransferase family-domain-containing protein [Umbelopsis sp. PMI_123]|nr:MBOAT, membrane-bound O-acyltransferase family-domain-containing protein [Umbelopsis sp. PMI_123]
MEAAMVSSEATSSSKFDHNSLLKHAVHNNIITNGSGLQSEPTLNTNGLHDPAEFDERPPLSKVNSSPDTTTPATRPSVRSTRRRRLTFRPRMTPLDLANPQSTNDQFRGFFTLFWLAMAFYVIQTVIRCYEQEGILLSLGFFRLFSKDGLALLVSDFAMISMTLFSVPFSKLMLWGWLPYDSIGFILQHIFQALFLFVNIYWTFWRDWPWVQSGFFTLHTLVMMMKMHSYTSLNGSLSIKLQRRKYLKEYLPKWIAEHHNGEGSPHLPTSPSLSDMTDDASIVSEASSQSEKDYRGYSETDAVELRALEDELELIEEDLVHGKTVFPNNITLMNYLDYLLVPSLVYWMEYPRTDRIRPWYVFEKSVATLGSFLLLYVTTERYILPKLYDPTMSEARVIVELLFPFMINYLLIFYIIFECILNAFAEISRFADRNFYEDWWNSVTYDEFARKWNKPVHHFLLRHVYASSMEAYKLTKTNATFLTFLLSSCLHELVLVIVTRKVRMYLFVLQMLQIPLIVIGRHPIIRKRSWLGNAFFWACMFVGPPLLGILYCREVFWSMKQAGTV